MNPTGAGPGAIILGLALVMAIAAVIYIFGVWAASRMRRGRVDEETTTAFPDQPQGEDDRREVEQVLARERAGQPSADHSGGADLSERAVGEGMRPVRQSPTQRERPVDADHDRGVAPHTKGDAAEGRERNPL